MKSKTSFFNGSVLRKDITRFAPAWGLYLTAILLLSLTLFTEEDIHLAQTMGLSLGIFSAVNFCYALVCGALLFGDLFNSRLCNALHAMPMRREGWFATHLTAGMLFSVVPNLIVSLMLLPQLGAYWYVSFIWLGGMTLTYLFFFGSAVLSAMCTGSRFAMTLVYGLINFLSILAMWIVQYLYEPLLYGVEINMMPFVFLSPVSYLCTNELEFLPFINRILAVSYHSDINGWPYVAGIAVIGVLMLIAALVLYRKRHLESAGDFITVRFLSPVFLVLYTLAAGMALFLFSRMFSTDQDYLFLVVGIIAGFITGSMLLQRTARVFKPATFVGLAVTAAVLFGSLGLVRLDVFGVVRWVPEAEQVRSVCVHSIKDEYSRYAYTTTDEAEIRELMDIHQDFIDQRDMDIPAWYGSEYLTYTLDNGKTVTRRYTMDFESPATVRLAPWLSKPEYVLQTDNVEKLLDNVNFIEVETYFDKYYNDTSIDPLELVTGADARELLEAVIADCEAGRMVQDFDYHLAASADHLQMANLCINVAGSGDFRIEVWENAVLTCKWLKENLED